MAFNPFDGAIQTHNLGGPFNPFENVIQPPPDNQEKTISEILGDTGRALMQPAATALEAISYLDKPRGAIAGMVQNAVGNANDENTWEAAKRGWRENTSFKESFNPEWVKDNPKTAAVAGFLTDVALDPTWLIPPAKLAKGVQASSKAIGLTEKIAPTAERLANSETGQKTINIVSDILGINRPTESAHQIYNATKASMMGTTKEGLNQVEKIINEALPNANRQDVEALVQRLVEAYPDIGQFARSADKVGARQAVLDTLFKDLETAQGGLKAVKEASGKIGPLTEEEKAIADILKANKLSINNLGEVVSAARNMGEVTQATKAAQGIDEHIKIKKAAVNLILSGKFPEEDLPKLRALFSDEELKALMPSLKTKFGNSPALAEIEAGIKVPRAVNAIPTSELEGRAISGLPDVSKPVNLNPNLSPVNLSADITKNLPNLMRPVEQPVESVLPKIRIGGKTQTAVNLTNITEDGRRLLANIQNVPELAQKIRTEQELQRQLNAVEKAKKAIQEADVSPEKITQVLDSAMNAGYSPSQVEGMFKASEVMRGVNQMMTSEAMKRALIPIEAAGEFSSGRHLRRMYAALENPEQHYNNLVKAGNKELANKFWEAYSKFEGEMKARGISINTGTFESRKNLPKVVQDQLGRIYEATYPFARGNKMAAEQFARYDYLKEIVNKFGSETMQAGYKKIPITPDGKYGTLEGKFLPERVYKEVMFSVARFDKETSSWERNVQRWKALKLINPASISRNIMSGAAMANVFGEVPVQKIPGLIKETLTDMRHGTERFLLARNNGLFETNIAKSDLDAIISRVRGEKPGVTDRFDALLGKGMNIFSMPDNFWRMLIFNHHIDVGKTAQDAATMATRAMFDYSNAPRWLDRLSRSGLVPFAKFPFFAAKETARALWERPAQVTKYTKAQNQVNTSDREQILPDYLKAKTLLPIGEGSRIVNGKPQKVQNNIDLSYILPFANDITVGNPIWDAIQLARTGKNSLGMDIIKPGMTDKEKVGAWAKFTTNALGPSVVAPYNIEKLYNAWQGNVDEKGRQYDLPWSAAQVGLGVKNVPININELYQQKMMKIQRDQRNIQDTMRQIARDRSLSAEQKKAQLQEHVRQIKNLGIEARKVQEAYKREKKREANSL